ncbi:hypothetical protein FHS07_001926 [Microbacterium proteolyticum]|uniref:Uncharacterized protein n=1 Tax=Microbacterium proteolyticum TaxID=1572644 RepID=A0A7W5GFV2_9MICO|nr:hypothetical protein [Microbacterium proteolyticum]MBB3158230.1 hypothetical protein [Microbacterium proteolyticum]
MSVAETGTPIGHRPAAVPPTHRGVIARSRRIVDASVTALDVEVLRMERDRMALATVHSLLGGDGFDREYAHASSYAARKLAEVVAVVASGRTNGFTRVIA